MKRLRKTLVLALIAGVLLSAVPAHAGIDYDTAAWQWFYNVYSTTRQGTTPPTLEEVAEKYGPAAAEQWERLFKLCRYTRSVDDVALARLFIEFQNDGLYIDEQGALSKEFLERYHGERDFLLIGEEYDPPVNPIFSGEAVHPDPETGEMVTDSGVPLYPKRPTGAAPSSSDKTSSSAASTSSVSSTTASKFADVQPDAWYYTAVTEMAKTGLIVGCDDGLFHPEKTLTVGEWCTILMRVATYNGANINGGYGGPHWASGVVGAAQQHGLTNCDIGMEDDLVNRGEAATAVVDISNLARGGGPIYGNGVVEKEFINDKYTAWWNKTQGERVNPKTWEKGDIPDWDVIKANHIQPKSQYGWGEIPHAWEPLYILKYYNYGIFNGVDEAGTFNPNGTLTRAEACQMLYNAGLTFRLNIYPAWSTGVNFTWPDDGTVCYGPYANTSPFANN